jgi:hypothetical protein
MVPPYLVVEPVSVEVGVTWSVTSEGMETDAEVVTVTRYCSQYVHEQEEARGFSVTKTLDLQGVGHEAGAVMVTGMLKSMLVEVGIPDEVELSIA